MDTQFRNQTLANISVFFLNVALATVSWSATPFRIPDLGITISDLCLVMATIPAVFAGSLPAQNSRLLWTLGFGNFLYVLGLALSVISLDSRLDTALDAAKIFLAFGLAFYVFGKAVRTPGQMDMAIKFWIFGAAANGFAGLWEVTHHKVLIYTRLLFYGRFAGLSDHPNELGPYCAVVAACAFFLWLKRPGWYRVWLSAAIVGLCGGVYASASLSGAAGLVVGLLAALLMSGSMTLIYIAGFTGLVASPLLFDWTFDSQATTNALNQRIRNAFDRGTDYITLIQRKESFRIAWDKIYEDPILGTGHTDAPLLPHNIFLFSWWHGGILAVTGTVIVMCAITVHAYAALFRARFRSGPMPTLVFALCIAFLIFWLETAVSPGGFRRSVWVTTWLVVTAIGLDYAARDRAVAARIAPEPVAAQA